MAKDGVPRDRCHEVRFQYTPETVAVMKEREPGGDWVEGKTYAYGTYTSPKWARRAFDRARTRRPDLLWMYGKREDDGTFTVTADHNDY